MDPRENSDLLICRWLHGFMVEKGRQAALQEDITRIEQNQKIRLKKEYPYGYQLFAITIKNEVDSSSTGAYVVNNWYSYVKILETSKNRIIAAVGYLKKENR